MWLKLCLLLIYLTLLFILSRVLETIAWCDNGMLSRQLLDPMVLSVTKLKAVLEQRGVSYEGVVEKSELTSLVDASGQVSLEEAELSLGEDTSSSETNFTAGAHFIEQVEDAKDSVWLVQVVSHGGQQRILSDSRWKSIKHKASKFGVRTGLLDCSLDIRYCHQKGWRSPFLLLALPSQFEKKASVAMYNYSGSVKESAVLHWVRDKLDERVVRINNPITFQQEWQNSSSNSLDPEIRAVLFTESTSAPLFYSALSVKFPGRVKFGLVSLASADSKYLLWKQMLMKENIVRLPAYVIYSAEKNYTYGLRLGEHFSFPSMERFLRFLYPCLNDIFIISFCVANVLSWFEFSISNCSFFRRVRKLIWCMFKYNMIVIMLWLPIIGIFQMPFFDQVPLIALKLERMFTTSWIGTVLRSDCSFYLNSPVCVCLTFGLYLVLVTVLCKKYREIEEDDNDWFNFSQMRTLAHVGPNDLFEPMRISGYGFDIFGSQFTQSSLWLQPSISSEYIKHLPTWRYCPIPLAARAAENVRKVEQAMAGDPALCERKSSSTCSDPDLSKSCLTADVGASNDNQSGIIQISSDTLKSLSPEDPCHTSGLNTPDQTIATKVEIPACQMCGQSVLHQESASRHKPSTSFQSCTHLPSAEPTKNTSQHACPLAVHHYQHEQDKSAALSPSSSLSNCDSSQTSHQPSENPSLTDSFASNSPPISRVSESSCTCPVRSADGSTSYDGPPLPSSVPMNRSGFPAGYIEGHQCVICLDEYVPHVMLCGLPCGHVFHETCIISWLNREKHFCPMCRWPSYKILSPLGS